MRFRKVIARWDNEKNRGVVKYQLGEIIVTIENENSASGYDAHFLIPGVIDRYVNFQNTYRGPLYKKADIDVADMIRSRIETWYPLEVLLKEESENVEIARNASLKELEQALMEKEKKREEIREGWQKKMDDYKGIARAWKKEVKENDVNVLEIDIEETEDGVIILTYFEEGEGVFKNRLHFAQEDTLISQEIGLKGKITIEEAIEWHFHYAKLDRKEKRLWEKYVHPHLPNYAQIIEEQLKGE